MPYFFIKKLWTLCSWVTKFSLYREFFFLKRFFGYLNDTPYSFSQSWIHLFPNLSWLSGSAGFWINQSLYNCFPFNVKRFLGKWPFSGSCTLTNQENHATRIFQALHFRPPPEARAFFAGNDAGFLGIFYIWKYIFSNILFIHCKYILLQSSAYNLLLQSLLLYFVYVYLYFVENVIYLSYWT